VPGGRIGVRGHDHGQAAAGGCGSASAGRPAAAARRAPGGRRAQLQSAGQTAARRGMEK